jgi:16S rRNA processing protein RimM
VRNMETDHRPESVPLDDLIVVARIVKTRALRGEVAADLLTDFPGRFEGMETVTAIAPDDSQRSLAIEEHWFHGNRIILKFAGYDSVDSAKALVGYELAVPADERIKLPAGQFYEWELAGCRVETIAGETIGHVRNIMRTGGVEILVVANDAGKEFLIPMARNICVEIDVEKKLIRIDPPEGLLEL